MKYHLPVGRLCISCCVCLCALFFVAELACLYKIVVFLRLSFCMLIHRMIIAIFTPCKMCSCWTIVINNLQKSLPRREMKYEWNTVFHMSHCVCVCVFRCCLTGMPGQTYVHSCSFSPAFHLYAYSQKVFSSENIPFVYAYDHLFLY